jgi:acid stress-induced BolA-like protein IbaG/YrbA
MDIEERVIRALKGLDLVDPEVKIFESQGSRILAAVVSPSFEQMEDADRQSLIWGKLIDELGDYDSRQVGYVVTATPREVAEDIAQMDAAPNS